MVFFMPMPIGVLFYRKNEDLTMKRYLSLLLAFALCLSLWGCGSSGSSREKANALAETMELYATEATQAEDTPASGDTDHRDLNAAIAAMEEDLPEEDGFTPGYTSYSGLETCTIEIFSVTLHQLANGDMRYTIKFQASEGMDIYAFDWTDGTEYGGSNLEILRDTQTTGGRESFSFDVSLDIFQESTYFLVSFVHEDFGEEYQIRMEKTEAMALQTSGTPVGEAKTISPWVSGNLTLHSLTAQLLDNGYVRYTLDYTAPQGRYISFFNPPQGDVFMYVTGTPTTGQRGTHTVDVKLEANNSIESISIKFFSRDYDVGDYISFTPVKF